MKGVWLNLKIHIVQKGDTLWEISKEYGADFEEVKKLNPQLSSPDMIMPGMKIKIPGTSKTVNSESTKETKMPKAEHPYKDTSPMPKPVAKKEAANKPEEMKPKMPMKPMKPEMPMKPETPMKPMKQMPMKPMNQKPMMDQDMINYTMINFPQMPESPQPTEHPHMNQHMQMPPQPIPVQMIPICCHCHQPCCPPPQQPMHHGSPHGHKKGDCGCGGPKPPHFRNNMESYDPLNEIPMPVMPNENPNMNYNDFHGAPFASTEDRYYMNGNDANAHGIAQGNPTEPYGSMPVPEPPDFGTMPAYNFKEDMNDPEK